MSLSPAQLTASRIALMPDGNIAETVIDNLGNAYARWFSGLWSQWFLVGAQAVDVSIAAANISGTDTAYISMIFRGGGRGVYALTSTGVTGTGL
jgi:hypothetical protein